MTSTEIRLTSKGLWLFVIAACILKTSNCKILIHDLDRSPAAILNLGKAYISNSYFRVLHRVDLTQIQESIKALTYLAKTIVNPEDILSSTIQARIIKLEQTFLKLKPPVRIRRWEQIGSIWKYISGSPDAEDLRIINSTSNKLIDQNEKQIKINRVFETRINNMTEEINKLITELDKRSSENRKELESINLLFNLDEFIQQLDNLEEALVLARHNIPSSRIIRAEEMTSIHQHLENNGLITVALDFASAYAVQSKETIVYILKIPRIKDVEYDLNFIEPVILNSSRISIPTNYYLDGPSSFALTTPCRTSRNIYICANSQLEPLTECIKQLTNGEPAQCPTEHIYSNNIIKQITDGNIIVNDGDTLLTSNCLSKPMPLKGSYLIQFANCSVQINNEEFANTNVEIPLLPFTPTTGLKVNSTIIINRIPLEFLQKLHLEQRDHISRLNLTTDNLQWNLHLFGWTSLGSISTIFIFLVAITIIWTIRPLITRKTTFIISEEKPANHAEAAAGRSQTGAFMIPQE